MSPLWNIKNHNRPSPRFISDMSQNAQFSLLIIFNRIIKGISLFASRFGNARAGMTVEAAIVLPLFLFFFLTLGSAMEMIRLHCNLEFALCDIGRRMSVYGYPLSMSEQDKEQVEKEPSVEQDNEWLAELKDLGFSYAYVKNEIGEYLSTDYLEASPLVDGIDGLQFLEGEIFSGEDCFDVVVTYRVAPFGEAAKFKGFRMANHYYGHLWNGYQIPGVEEDVVYIAENGSVYHEDAMCSHLFLSVREVSLLEAYESRNSNGAKYKPCEYCEKLGLKGTVYITEDGDRIHSIKDCAGLKRTVYEIPRDEASGYAPCMRCGKSE